MSITSCILLNPVRAELQAACVQAEAALQAGVTQATAAYWVGGFTVLAGAFALGAAFLSGKVTIKAAREQIGAARADVAEQLRAGGEAQAKQRSHDLKSKVYIPAVDALAHGLYVVVKLANLTTPIHDAMAGYNERMPALFAVHLVAEVETTEKFQKALRGLQELHQVLLVTRPVGPFEQYTLGEWHAWCRQCTAKLEDAIPSMVAAVAAMRGELDLPIDEKRYTMLIRDALKAAIDRNEVLLFEMMRRFAEP